MQRNGASRKRSANRGRGGRWLPAAVERLESRYAMDGGGMSPTVALPPYNSALGIGSETRLPVVVAPVQAAAPLGVAAPAPSFGTANAPAVIVTALQAGAPTADQQTQGAPGGTDPTDIPATFEGGDSGSDSDVAPQAPPSGKSKMVIYVDQPGAGGTEDVYLGGRGKLPQNRTVPDGSDLDVGHTFIEIIDGRTGERFRAGLYPTRPIDGPSPRPGTIMTDLDHAYDVRREEDISEEQFDKIKKRLERDRLTPPAYDPDDYNCTDYAIDVWDDVLPPLPDRTAVITPELGLFGQKWLFPDVLSSNPISNPGMLGQDLAKKGGVRAELPNTPAR